MELDDAVKMTDLVQEFSSVGLVIGEVRIEKKRKGFQKAVISLKNTEHKSREAVLRFLENVEGIQFVKYTA